VDGNGTVDSVQYALVDSAGNDPIRDFLHPQLNQSRLRDTLRLHTGGSYRRRDDVLQRNGVQQHDLRAQLQMGTYHPEAERDFGNCRFNPVPSVASLLEYEYQQ
jgi:hypothetical protein